VLKGRAHRPGRIWTINAETRLGPKPKGEEKEHASEPSYEDQVKWAAHVIDNNGPVENLPIHVRCVLPEDLDTAD
jgi:hypothetical protein